MTSIRQTIPSYHAGISQQPDELKTPGQVVEAKNVYPDVVQGLMKRPGSKLIASLSDNGNAALNSEVRGRWFHYYRDEAEQYIGQVHRDGDFNVWRCSDGQAMTVNFDVGTSTALANYLTHTDDHDIQALTLNDYTYFVNRTKTTGMTGVTAPAKVKEAYIELKQIKYAAQYGLEFFSNNDTKTLTTATRLEVSYNTHSSGSSKAVYTGGTCDSIGTQIFGPAETNETGKTNLYFRITANGQPTTSGGSNASYVGRYNITTDLLYGGEGWAKNDQLQVDMTKSEHTTEYTITVTESSSSTVKANLALIRPTPTPFDGKTVVTADGILGELSAAILDPANSDVDSGSTGFEVTQIGTGLYVKRTDNLAFNISTPSPELMNVMTDSVQIASDLPSQCKHGYVLKVSNSDANEDDYYVKFVGNNNADGQGVWEECPEPGRKIDIDDATMPVQMVREADGTFTVKQISWAQCLVGDYNETTKLGSVTPPSFIGDKINRMLFYRNRLVLLSGENINMSQPGEFFNFWPKSAITYTVDDNIDISVSSVFPAVLYDGIPTNSGLVLLTKTQQFLLSTDSDILSPATAKVNSISTYNFNYKTNPISLGTTIGFLDNAGKYSRFWEMTNVLREGEPQVVEQTKVVNRLFDSAIEKISNSRENGVIFFSKKNSPTLYCYKYFISGEKRVQQSWFTWELSGDIQHHAVLDDALYTISRSIINDKSYTANGSTTSFAAGFTIPSAAAITVDVDGVEQTSGWTVSSNNVVFSSAPANNKVVRIYEHKDVMQRFSLKIDDTGHFITDDKGTASDTTDDITYNIHLDNATSIASSSLSAYDAANNRTTFTLPTGFNNSSKQLAVIVVPSASDTTFQGRTEDVSTFVESGTTKVSLTGNWKTYDPQYVDDGNTGDDVTPANNIILGYQFDMQVQFPTIYHTKTTGNVTRADTRSSLVVHRLKLSLGESGMYTTLLERVGKPDYSEIWEPPLADLYGSNKEQFNKEATQTIPIYEKNNNLTIKLKSTHPSPATLYSLAWEGDMTTHYYKGA